MGSKEYSKDLIVDWNKFKSNAKGKMLERAKQGYIEFCGMLNEVDFKLVSDYVNSQEKVELTYIRNDSIRINMMPNSFKTQTYKSIISFKAKLKENNDEFIKFIGSTNRGSLMVRIKTFDGGKINLDITAYSRFVKARQDFYDKLKEVNGYTTDFYMRKDVKMNLYIDDVKLNLMTSNDFKRCTYKVIINFKKQLKENNDTFVKFTNITNSGNLMAKIKTLNNGEIDIDVGAYCKFTEGRRSTYGYCKEKGYKILSPYIGALDKMLIDFNCGHNPHWIIPSVLKNGISCPVCNESKGEKTIRLYLENNNIKFKQEYVFADCKHKYTLPFDFYIPNYNLCIEFDGIQHFEVREHFGGNKEFKNTQIRDEIKNKYCKDNNINLLRIPYWKLDNIENILDEEFDRLRKLNNELKEII
ncbi:MAG: hypothetical protein KHZ90_09870 [Veillonella parvula]|uniref:DUF559 domain-containing protein n=1 Tax=Veillonella parvula TaxID=29466 RepID=A0A942WSL3_VEIPA|nr:hypothetical protein [Veillonella parvula]MBS4894063.1 hypothetical protein [Veillonella parvula]